MNDWECFGPVTPLVRADQTWPGGANPDRYIPRCAQIMRLEGLFGTMNQNPEVFTGYAKIAAHLILIPLLNKQGLQHASILFREFGDGVPDLLLHLPPDKGFGNTDRRIENGIDHFGIGRNLSALQSIMLI